MSAAINVVGGGAWGTALANAAASAAARQAARLDARAGASDDPAERARLEQAAVAARVRGAEAEIAAGRVRAALVGAQLEAQRANLAAQKKAAARRCRSHCGCTGHLGTAHAQLWKDTARSRRQPLLRSRMSQIAPSRTAAGSRRFTLQALRLARS